MEQLQQSDSAWTRFWRGNRWYHGVIAFLLVGVIVIGVNLVFEGEALGQSPTRCGETSHCTATEHRDNFRAGRYGYRDANDTFPRRIKRMMKAEYRRVNNDASAVSTLSADAWFRQFNNDTRCYWVGGWVQMCDPDPGISGVEKKTYKITLACGGAAVLGFARGGGWWGAGIGGGGCLWATFIDMW